MIPVGKILARLIRLYENPYKTRYMFHPLLRANPGKTGAARGRYSEKEFQDDEFRDGIQTHDPGQTEIEFLEQACKNDP